MSFIMNIHVGNLIRNELRCQERSVTWFAQKICCTRTHVYKILEKDNIDIILLLRISQVLNHNFFEDISKKFCPIENDTSVSL